MNGVKTSYTWDGAQLVSQKTGNEAIYFLYHGSSRVGLEYKGNTYYYIYNLQGDVVGLVNSNGNTVVSYTYDAWGNPESTTGSMASTLGAANPFRYRSYYFDTESGLYYLMSRYYDPVVGRFLNADVYTTTGQGFIGCNMFAYCLNNPVLYQDSNGQSVVLTLLTFGCAVAGFCALVATAYVAYQVVDHYVDGSSALRIPKIADNVIPFVPPPQNNNNNKKQEGPVPIVPPVPSPKPKQEEEKKPRGTLYYHVTTPENAMLIWAAGQLTGSSYEGGYVYAWRSRPDKRAIDYSGAHKGVIISFRTNASFQRDPGISDPYVLRYQPVQSVFPGPINIWDVQILR